MALTTGMTMGKMTVLWQVRILRRRKKPLTQEEDSAAELEAELEAN